jgi:hypothetical protein
MEACRRRVARTVFTIHAREAFRCSHWSGRPATAVRCGAARAGCTGGAGDAGAGWKAKVRRQRAVGINMCGDKSTHLQSIFFLRVFAKHLG